MKQIDINRGDLITAYYKGIWSVISVNKIDKTHVQIYARLIANSQYELVRHTKFMTCDIHWCEKITKETLQTVRSEPYETRAKEIIEYYFDSGLKEILS